MAKAVLVQESKSGNKGKLISGRKKGFGKWGNLNFIVSRNKARTFSGMKWKSTFNFDVEEREKKVSKVTFKGIAPDEFSFNMRLSVFAGMKPLKEIRKINKVARKGTAYRLIIGGKKYGKHKLAITSITRNLEYFDNKGNLWVAELQVNMKEKPT